MPSEKCKCSINTHGLVFNIQKCTLHDGPGIRTLVFMKGCKLRCQWCANPESQKDTPEISFDENRCIGCKQCGRCMDTCPTTAISKLENGMIKIDRQLCTLCGKCVERCPSKAITIMGEIMSIEDILEVVEKDDNFYWRSGGGITVGGGDPVYQAYFVQQLLKRCRERGMDTAIETAGYAKFTGLEKICQFANLIFYDIKHIDSAKHKAFTGVGNELILDNLKRLSTTFPQTRIIVRTPIVPGFNDSEDVIESIANFLSSMKKLMKYELLPYHGFGEPKYHKLERNYALKGLYPPSKEHMAKLKKIIYNAGL